MKALYLYFKAGVSQALLGIVEQHQGREVDPAQAAGVENDARNACQVVLDPLQCPLQRLQRTEPQHAVEPDGDRAVVTVDVNSQLSLAVEVCEQSEADAQNQCVIDARCQHQGQDERRQARRGLQLGVTPQLHQRAQL